MVQSLIVSISGYPGLWLICATSGILVPVPEDVPLLYAGTRIAEGIWSWPLTLLAAWAGVAGRDLAAWSFGRVVGRWVLDGRRLSWLLSSRKITRARRMVARHGVAAVLMGRFMIGFRTPVFAAAGAMGVPFRSFVVVDGLGLAVAVPLAVGLGYAFGHPIAELAAVALQRTTMVVGIATGAVVLWFAWKAVRAGALAWGEPDAFRALLARRGAGAGAPLVEEEPEV